MTLLRLDYSDVEPMPPSQTYHIIWNLLLADKQLELTPEALAADNINHIVAILPAKSEFEKLNTQIPDCPFTVLEYGYEHTTQINQAQYQACGEMIDSMARAPGRHNILIFCNNGYQRSIPFLVYYLTKFHADEVPTVGRAVEIILSQVDRANYAAQLEPMTNAVSLILGA
jgi:hypothetical protein